MKKVITWILLLVVLVFIGVFGWLLLRGSAYQTAQALKQYDCEKAMEQYNNVDSTLQRWRLEKILPDVLSEVNSAYNFGVKTQEETMEIYDVVSLFDEYSACEDAYNLFQRLIASKQAYRTASEAWENKDYALAFKSYSEVIYEDSLYEEARAAFNLAKSTYTERVKNEVYLAVQKGNYDQAKLCVDTASSILYNSEIEKIKSNLDKGVYEKISVLLNHSWEWERRDNHGYTLYAVDIAFDSSGKYFYCIYTYEWDYENVINGVYTQYSGPCVYYAISGDGIKELDYSEYKGINFSFIYDWDYRKSNHDKIKILEDRLD